MTRLSRPLPGLRQLALATLLACSTFALAQAAAPDAALAARGARLFSGQTRLANGGAACISCHAAAGGGLSSEGGHLAVGLGSAWTQIGPAGIQAMIATPPFAPMAAAYGEHPLTADETGAILAFLQRSAQQPRPAGALQRQGSMLLGGGVGALLVLLVLQLAWRRRVHLVPRRRRRRAGQRRRPSGHRPRSRLGRHRSGRHRGDGGESAVRADGRGLRRAPGQRC